MFDESEFAPSYVTDRPEVETRNDAVDDTMTVHCEDDNAMPTSASSAFQSGTPSYPTSTSFSRALRDSAGVILITVAYLHNLGFHCGSCTFTTMYMHLVTV